MKIRVLLVLFLSLISIVTAFAQLPRKGGLGAAIKLSQDSTGIEIVQVFSHSNAQQLGIRQGDILLSTNNRICKNVKEFISITKNWLEGDFIEFEILRGTKIYRLSGTISGKPKETSSFGIVKYSSIDYDGGKLASILISPDGVRSPPALLFLPGIGCTSYDFGDDPDHVIKLLVESLVAQGIAVFRVEKPGMGDSQDCIHCHDMDFNYEISAYKAALAQLKKESHIDTNQIFLFGESLGTITAPYVAQSSPVAGIIAWGGITTSWFEYYMRLKRDQKIYLGVDYSLIDEELRVELPFYYDFLVAKMTPSQLEEVPEYKIKTQVDFTGNLWKGLHHYSFFHTLNDKDILTAYKNTDCRVLALAGDHDIHTSDTTWAFNLARSVNHYRPNTAQSRILRKTTHHYYRVPSMETYISRLKDGELTPEFMSENFNESIPSIVANWIFGKSD